MAHNKRSYSREELYHGGLFNAPLIAAIGIFIFIPVIGTIVTSLFRSVTFMPDKFIGVQNFIRIAGDEHFLSSLSFTVAFVIVSVALELVFGLLFALILNEKFKGRKFFRIVLLIPWAVPIAVSARLWQLLYNYEFGLLNHIGMSLGIIHSPVNWLGSPTGAFVSLVLSDVWKTTPFIGIILLAGLSTIPKELYEQAVIDGTTYLQRFFKVTLPLLLPVVIVALLFRTIDAVRIFDLIYVLTGGGPGGSTTSVSMYAFNYYLSGDFGYGSAVSVVLFLFAGLLSVAYLKFGRFGEWTE